MAENKTKPTCPHCSQDSGVEIIYGCVATISEALRNSLKKGNVVFGGTFPQWDWEEELINTRCLRCNHEWHREHMNLSYKHHLDCDEANQVADMQHRLSMLAH